MQTATDDHECRLTWKSNEGTTTFVVKSESEECKVAVPSDVEHHFRHTLRKMLNADHEKRANPEMLEWLAHSGTPHGGCGPHIGPFRIAEIRRFLRKCAKAVSKKRRDDGWNTAKSLSDRMCSKIAGRMHWLLDTYYHESGSLSIVEQVKNWLEEWQKKYGIGFILNALHRLLDWLGGRQPEGATVTELRSELDLLLDIHTGMEVRDATVYHLPFFVERCFGDTPDTSNTPKYVVSRALSDGFDGDLLGEEIIKWGDKPIQKHLDDLAKAEFPQLCKKGLDKDETVRALVLQRLTIRPIAWCKPPSNHNDEVRVRFATQGVQQFAWQKTQVTPDEAFVLDVSAVDSFTRVTQEQRGKSAKRRMIGKAKQPTGSADAGTAPADPDLSTGNTGTGGSQAPQGAERLRNSEISVWPPPRSDGHDSSDPRCCYLRIFSFICEQPEAWLNNTIEELGSHRGQRLVVDVRDNGGGYVCAAEGLLAALCSSYTPLKFGLRCRDDTRRELVRQLPNAMGPWASNGSGPKALFNGTTNAALVGNFKGHVLIANALSLSAAHLFVLGWVENDIGPVILQDGSPGTGAGCLLTYRDLQLVGKPSQPELPDCVELKVELLRLARTQEQDRWMQGTAAREVELPRQAQTQTQERRMDDPAAHEAELMRQTQTRKEEQRMKGPAAHEDSSVGGRHSEFPRAIKEYKMKKDDLMHDNGELKKFACKVLNEVATSRLA